MADRPKKKLGRPKHDGLSSDGEQDTSVPIPKHIVVRGKYTKKLVITSELCKKISEYWTENFDLSVAEVADKMQMPVMQLYGMLGAKKGPMTECRAEVRRRRVIAIGDYYEQVGLGRTDGDKMQTIVAANILKSCDPDYKFRTEVSGPEGAPAMLIMSAEEYYKHKASEEAKE